MRARMLIAIVITAAATACSSRSGTLQIVDSWAPPTPPGAPAAAVYLTIDNGSDNDDRLVDVAIDRCGAIELHATWIDEDRIMRMRLAEPEMLEMEPGETMEMIPGGLHVMCIDPASPFVEGEQLDLTVTFDDAGNLPVTTPVENR